MNPSLVPADGAALTPAEVAHVQTLDREARRRWVNERCDALHAGGWFITEAVRASMLANAEGLEARS